MAQPAPWQWVLQYSYRNALTGIEHQYYQACHQQVAIDGVVAQQQAGAGSDTWRSQSVQPLYRTFSGAFTLSVSQALAIASAWTGEPIATNTAIETEQRWVPHQGRYVAAWIVIWPLQTGAAVWRISIDASSGAILHTRDEVVHCQFDEPAPAAATLARPGPAMPYAPTIFAGEYYHLPWPIESPDWGESELVIADELIDPVASPHGWHHTGIGAGQDYYYTRGNNAYAYYSANLPPDFSATTIVRNAQNDYLSGNVPDGLGMQSFNYPQNLLTADATGFLDREITNVFVWNNRLHDLLYQYGFTEASGNFQHTNYAGGGLANDAVLAEVQDGYDTNNASFYCPRDGLKPRMQLYLWDSAGPGRAIGSGFDNMVMSHEYFHGVIFRLVGGPLNTFCVRGNTHGAEGYCDIFGLLMTLSDRNGNGVLERDVVGEGIRTVGNDLLAEPVDGPGLRPAPYSPDWPVNSYTYAAMPGLPAPHGVGFLWGTILWDATWALIDKYGFEADPWQPAAEGGNIRMLRLLVESLRHLPCEPNFLEMRDALLRANALLYHGEGNGLLWSAFARRGLGYSAGPDGVAAYDMPPIFLQHATDMQELHPLDVRDFTLRLRNFSDDTLHQVILYDTLPPFAIVETAAGATLTDQILAWPLMDPLYPGDTIALPFRLQVAAETASSTTLYSNDAEGEVSDIVTGGGWQLIQDAGQAHSGSYAWHIAAPANLDESSLTLHIDLEESHQNYLSFYHQYQLDTLIQGGLIDLYLDDVAIPTAERVRYHTYPGILYNPFVPVQKVFTGKSGGYQRSLIDLRGLSGTLTIRFRLLTLEPASGSGFWTIDDISLIDLYPFQLRAGVTSRELYPLGDRLSAPGIIIWPSGSPLPVEWLSFTARPVGHTIRLDWQVLADAAHAGFTVERMTADTPPQDLAWIPAQPVGDVQSYMYVDENVVTGVTYYYRLRQKDNDARETLSDWRSAQLAGHPENKLLLWPNPAGQNVTITWPGLATPQRVTITLFDQLGRRILTQEEGYEGSLHLETAALPPGVYEVRVQAGVTTATTLVIIP